jgi:sugar phosphate isomerase/epimerase
MPPKIALGLYSIREILPGNFNEIVRMIPKMGYAGVETDGFGTASEDADTFSTGFVGTTPKEAASLFKGLGLTVTSVHIFPPPMGKKFDKVKETLELLDCKVIVSGFDSDQFKTLQATQVACDEINACYKLCKANGLTLMIHNHVAEYLEVEGTYPFRYLLANTDPEVLYEIDTYWVKVAGYDPAKAVKEVGRRAPFLHIKDGPGGHDEPNVAVGSGIMNFPGVMNASAENAEWLIVEFDSCGTDILKAVEESSHYLHKITKS